MRILLGMPTTGTIPMRTVACLLRTAKEDVVEPYMVEGSLVYDARDDIARFAIQNGYDYVLYVDSDMIFTRKDIDDLMKHQADIVSGLYITRHGEGRNVAYTKVITRQKKPFRTPKLVHDTDTAGYGEVEGVGFGFCLIKTSVLEKMGHEYVSLFEPRWGVGEDIAFCLRAKKCGFKIMIDRDVKLGHIGSMVYEPT